MDFLRDLLDAVLHDPTSLIRAVGYVGLAVIVFAESGVLLGLFLPGDSLLFTAGLLAAKGDLSLAVLIPLLFVAAVAGDSFGYAFGRRAGTRLFTKPDARLFKQAYVEKTQAFYARHGPKTIVLARFVPIVRTLAPILAGVGRMEYSRFVRYNLAGGLVWAAGVTTAGYVLGASIPDVDRYLLPIIAVIVFLSLLPPAIEILRERRRGIRPSVGPMPDVEAADDLG